MSVRIAGDTIVLEGRCLVEDAEALLLAIQQSPALPVDVALAERVHTAVVQVLLALKPALRGCVRDPILARHIFGQSNLG